MTTEYSPLARSIAAREEALALRSLYSAASAWSEKEATRQRIDARRAAACAPNGFWAFDRDYFPPEMYDGQYAPANRQFHGAIITATEQQGRRCTLILGPHDHAKSAMVYKKVIHAALTGQRHYIGLVSETLTTPRSILDAVAGFLQRNARIRHDYPDLDIVVDAADELFLRTRENRGTWIKCFSEFRSPRGTNVELFQRPDLVCVEDFENMMSPLDAEAVERRRRKLAEYQSALAEDGCLVQTANNFAEECVANQMLTEYRDGNLDPSWNVLVFAAWKERGDQVDNKRLGPLWPERYVASSEAELKTLLHPMDDATWDGSYQQRPRKPSGRYFLSAHYAEWNELPEDILALVWCDPNLAVKSKGDTTAMLALAFSRTTGRKYILEPRCRSFADSNDLLDAYMHIVARLYELRIPILGLGFEGVVSQESHWTSHVRNYCALHGIPVPRLEFRHYNVSVVAGNTQIEFGKGAFLFPQGFAKTEEGKVFCQQLWSFTGTKRSGHKDDAPDALISANEFLFDKGYSVRPPSVEDYYSVRKRRLGPINRY